MRKSGSAHDVERYLQNSLTYISLLIEKPASLGLLPGPSGFEIEQTRSIRSRS